MSQNIDQPVTPARAPEARTARLDELDMTKGALVVLMVVYHTLNYSTDYTLGFVYLPFLPPSFILITGFLIGALYLRPDRTVRSAALIRAFLRGLRLVFIFTVLNVVAQNLGRHRGTSANLGIFDDWIETYVSGGSAAAFSVLLPIGYLLMLAPVLSLIARFGRIFPSLLALAAASGSIILEKIGSPSVNLSLLSAGLIGVSIGSWSGVGITGLGRCWFVFVIAYAIYAYSVGASEQNALVQLLGAFLAVAVIFSLSVRAGSRAFLCRRLIVLGQYSLLAYIFQIALLQVISRITQRPIPWSLRFNLEMIGVLLVMVAVVEAIHWSRKRSRFVATVYAAALG